jgi:hypothetical protein
MSAMRSLRRGIDADCQQRAIKFNQANKPEFVRQQEKKRARLLRSAQEKLAVFDALLLRSFLRS